MKISLMVKALSLRLKYWRKIGATCLKVFCTDLTGFLLQRVMYSWLPAVLRSRHMNILLILLIIVTEFLPTGSLMLLSIVAPMLPIRRSTHVLWHKCIHNLNDKRRSSSARQIASFAEASLFTQAILRP